MRLAIGIGGGSFQRGESKAIDEYAIKNTGKANPSILFFPTASRDDQGYAKRFKQYMRSLDCKIEVMRLFHTKLSKEEIMMRIMESDIIYFGAGNMKRLMSALHEWDLVDTISKAYAKGVICIGNSAGASALFTYGYSDINDDGTSFSYIKGMNLVDGIFCPHAQDEKRKGFFRTDTLDSLIKYPCEDCHAIVIKDGAIFRFPNE